MAECIDNQKRLKRCQKIYDKLLSDISKYSLFIPEQQLKVYKDFQRKVDRQIIPEYNKCIEKIRAIYSMAHNGGEK